MVNSLRRVSCILGVAALAATSLSVQRASAQTLSCCVSTVNMTINCGPSCGGTVSFTSCRGGQRGDGGQCYVNSTITGCCGATYNNVSNGGEACIIGGTNCTYSPALLARRWPPSPSGSRLIYL